MTEPGVVMASSQQIKEALGEAHALRHPQRAMRVTLDCAHLRLMPWINTVMGIGAKTSCGICPPGEDGYAPTRTVVNCEETGVLHDSWRPKDASDA